MSNQVKKNQGNYKSNKTIFDRMFFFIFPLTVAGFISFGYYMSGVESKTTSFKKIVSQVNTQFLIKEKPKPVVKKIIKKKIEKKKVEKKEKPVDLTEKPKLAQKKDDIQKSNKKKKKVRRVYGLKKVYSKGFGTGGMMSDAVIGKIGNTLNKDVDTIIATKEEIKGTVVSVTTVTTAPVFKKKVKPEYSKEMIENKIEGVIKVRVLIDIDGKVKKSKALNDLGFNSASMAMQATLKMLFKPAMRGDIPVATWIIIPIRFMLIG